MADFDLAMALTADGTQAVAEVDRVSGALDKTAAAERNAASAAATLESATGKATTAVGKGAAAQSQAGQATAAAVTATQRAVVAQSNLAAAEARSTAAVAALAVAQRNSAAAAALDAKSQEAAAVGLANAQARVASAAAGVTRAQARLSSELDTGTGAANKNGYAIRNVGQQFGDFGLQVAGGQSVARAFGQQAGQLGYALSEMGGKLGKVGTFLVGPWGIALTIGAAVLAPMIEKLFQANSTLDDNVKKLETAAGAADSFGNAQSLLGRIIDLTTGKFKTQNQVLIQTIKLLAQANLAKAQGELNDADPSKKKTLADRLRAGVNGTGLVAGNDNSGILSQNKRVTDAQQRGLDAVNRRLLAVVGNTALANRDPSSYSQQVGAAINVAIDQVDKLGVRGKVAGKSLTDVKLAITGIGKSALDQAAALEVITAAGGGAIGDELKPYERAKKPRKPKKPPKPKSTEARDEFGRDTEDKLAGIRDSLSDTPAVVRQVNQQVRQLDDLIDDLSRKKPPGFEKMIAEAKELRPLIVNSINKPFDEFVKSQAEQLQISKLQASGQNEQAEALRIILGLEKQIGPLTPARKDAVLATVEALRAEQRQIDINREHTGMYLDALSQIKGVVEQATQAFVRGDLGQFIKSPKKLLDAFQNLQGQALFSKLFGDVFRDLQDQVNGVSTVKDASDRMAEAVDQVTRQTGQTTAALGDLANAARGAAGAVSGQSVPDAGASVDAPTGDVVVTGKRTPKISRNPTELFTQAIGQVGTKVAGLFTNPENAAKIGANIGKFAGKGLEGAATGTFVNGLLAPIGKALGFKTSKLGGQVGGAVGAFLPIPFGKEVGAVVGSVIGGLFKKTKDGSATLGNVDGSAGVTGTSGNSAGLRKSASASAGAVGSAIDQIVNQLGGQLGNFSVSLGERKGKFAVDSSGQGRTKVKGSGGAVAVYDTQEEANAAALRDAIVDGAIGGLSAAMQKALQQNSDVDKAVAEALKVKEVETLIGGLGGQLKAAFDDVARNAAERVRIAKQYGLDVAAVEKANAAERTKLIEDTLKSSVGSLQDLLTSMASGDLFAGSGADQRKAILAQIADTQTKATAGEAGAADTLAQLYRNLLAVSKDTFGTAGDEFSSDRATVNSGATAVIKAEQDRLNSAAGIQQATTAAVEKNNTLTSETNDLLARQNATLDSLPLALASRLSGLTNDNGYSYGLTARNVDLR